MQKYIVLKFSKYISNIIGKLKLGFCEEKNYLISVEMYTDMPILDKSNNNLQKEKQCIYFKRDD